jgi:hypothetical protein
MWRCLVTASSKHRRCKKGNPPLGQIPIACFAGVFVVVASLAFLVPAASAQGPQHRLTRAAATRLVLHQPKIADWLRRYPRTTLVTLASYKTPRGVWEVKVSSGAAGVVAVGTVDDRTGRVLEAWSGPQVAWPISRGPLGGKRADRPCRMRRTSCSGKLLRRTSTP